MNSSKTKLSRLELKNIVFCSFIMSGVDGYIDEDEIDVIREFTEVNWVEKFGDIDDFFIEIDSDVVDVFVPAGGKFDIEKQFVYDALKDMKDEVISILRTLMIAVMEADGIIDPAEVSLIKSIDEYIGRM